MEGNNVIFTGNKATHVSKRINRLISFIEQYKELWYDNGRGLEDKINLITSDEEEKSRIKVLYAQAEEDYAVLRMVRSRVIDHKKNNITTPLYKISDEELDALRQAGIGRTFGLSDENQAEYDRLIKSGVDEEVVQFIFKKFSSYQRFKEIFCEAMEEGKEKDLVKRCPKAYSFIISEIDLSKSNGVRVNDRNYIDFLRDVLGTQYFIFDGARLTERMDDFINYDEKKSNLVLNDSYKNIIRRIYGLGIDKMSSKDVARELGVSNSRVRQILSQGMLKLSGRKAQLLDIVYLLDQSEAVKFLVNYFKNNDIFRTQIIEHNQELDGGAYNEGLTNDMYSTTFAKKLELQVEELMKERNQVSAELKMSFDERLDRFENLKLQKFFLGKLTVDGLGLSYRTHNCLTMSGISTVEDIIKFSRKSKYSIKLKVRNMGEKSYEELKDALARCGLTLEDEDKSDDTRLHNDDLLHCMSEVDAARFYLYLEQIKSEIAYSIMGETSKAELNMRIESIKRQYGIYISNEDLEYAICSRIDDLDSKNNYDSTLETLDVPYDIIRSFKFHGINKMIDIYRLRDRDVNYMKKKYGAYFDLIIAEMERIGLEYPLLQGPQSQAIKQPTYINRKNVELISFLIDELDCDKEHKKELKESLFEKINHIEKSESQSIDDELDARIEKLKSSYKTLRRKCDLLADVEKSKNNEKSMDKDDSFGDID